MHLQRTDGLSNFRSHDRGAGARPMNQIKLKIEEIGLPDDIIQSLGEVS